MKIVLFILLFIYYVEAQYNETVEPKRQNAKGVPKGDLLLQKITVSTGKKKPCFLFWWANENSLLYTDSLTDMGYFWDYDTAQENGTYYKDISGEELSFLIPFKQDKKKYILGSDDNIRIATTNANKNNWELSDPIFSLKMRGFCVGKAHCDKNGVLYFLASYNLKVRDPTKGTKLYRMQDDNATSVHNFTTKAKDFVFSNDWKKIYVITHNGQCVDSYDIDSQTGKLTNNQLYFNISSIQLQTGANMVLESIETDKQGNLFLIAGQNLIRVPQKTKTVDKIVQLPEKPIAVTFGGYENRNLIISTGKSCNHNEIQSGAIFVLSGLNTGGIADPLFKGM